MDQNLWIINADDGEKCYMLVKDKSKDGLKFQATDGKSAWEGNVSHQTMSQAAKKLKMKEDEYITETKQALIQQKSKGQSSFQFQLSHKGKDLLFVWKKNVASENIKFQLGTADLKAASNQQEIISNLFDQAITMTSRFQADIKKLNAENERLSAERETVIKRLGKCVQSKEDLESDLYSKFAVVLNHKKRKICELQEEMESEENKTQNNVSSTVANENTGKRKTEDSDDGALASDYSTDDDKPTTSKKSKLEKQTVSPSGDSSLLLDISDDDEPILSTRPRRKKDTSLKKMTPSKPSIAKPTPKRKAAEKPSTSRRVSSTKRTTSDASSDKSAEVDDLFDEL